VGIDWSDKAHAVCVVNEAGEKEQSFRVAHSPEGLATLMRRLRDRGGVRGVAVETKRHLLVWALVEAGFPVYPINPKLSHAWRQGWTVSEAKGDDRDAWVLADGLSHGHARLAVFVPQDEATRTLQQCCQDEQRLIGDRTRLVQRLEDALKQYYPGVLAWFADWTSPSAWDLVWRFPTAEALASSSKRQLMGFLKQHRIRVSPRWQERIAGRAGMRAWPVDPAAVVAKAEFVRALVAQLRGLAAILKRYRKQIDALFQAHPDHAVFASLPGAGPKLAPRLLSGFGADRAQFPSAQVVEQVSGTAPVTYASGASKQVHIRHACRKGFRCALHQFAGETISRSAWARAYYDLARARGQSHALALRNLAKKWLKILYRMWQTGETYDEQRYLEQLVKRGSPIAQAITRWKTRGKTTSKKLDLAHKKSSSG